MKLKRLLSFLLAVSMMLCMAGFSVSADEEIPERTISLTPEKPEVYTREEFTVEVKISGVEAVGARWQLDYDENYFDFVAAEFKATEQKNDNLSPEIMSITGVLPETVAIYTFQAKNLATEGGAEEKFTLSKVDIRTVEDVWLGTDVSDHITIENTNVAIVLRTIEGVTVKYDGTPTTEEEITDKYDAQPHYFEVTATTPDVTISYEVDGVAVSNPVFSDADEYIFKYTIEKEGYQTVTDEVKLTITPAEFASIQANFDDTDITEEIADNEYEHTYDGDEHSFTINPVETVGEAEVEVTYSYTFNGGEAQTGAPVIKEAGTYKITYMVEANNHEAVEKTVTIIVGTAEFENVPVKFDGTDITEEVEDGSYTYHYDGDSHNFSVGPVTTVDGTDANVTYSYKFEDGEETTGTPVIKEAGTYEITYKVESDNHTTIEKTITITVDVPDYLVEVKFGQGSDYVHGKKLVLVYTKAKDVAFKYANSPMFDVTDKDYKYNGTDSYPHVYALVCDAFAESGTTVDEKLAPYKALVSVDYENIPAEGIDYTVPCDINGVDELDNSAVGWNDVMAAYTTIEGNSYAFSSQIKGVIKTDVNGDKSASSADVLPILDIVYP